MISNIKNSKPKLYFLLNNVFVYKPDIILKFNYSLQAQIFFLIMHLRGKKTWKQAQKLDCFYAGLLDGRSVTHIVDLTEKIHNNFMEKTHYLMQFK